MKKFLLASEIAKIEKTSQRTITRWINEGVFPNARMVGNQFRVPMPDYLKWREASKISNIKKKNGQSGK